MQFKSMLGIPGPCPCIAQTSSTKVIRSWARVVIRDRRGVFTGRDLEGPGHVAHRHDDRLITVILGVIVHRDGDVSSAATCRNRNRA